MDANTTTYFPATFDRRNETASVAELRLTRRQRAVLALMCEGMPNKAISRKLNIAAGTVKCHVTSIFRALNVSSRVQAFLAAQKLGLIGTPQAPQPRVEVQDPKQPIVIRVALNPDLLHSNAELRLAEAI